MRPFAIFIFLLGFSISSAYCADLADLQISALQNRKVIERYKNNLEKSVQQKNVAESGYYPSLDIAYTVNSLNEDATFEAKENSVFYGAVTLNLFAGFKDKYNIQSAALQQQVESYKLKGLKQDMMQNVALHYLNVYARKANLKAQQDAFTTLRRVYEDGEKRNQVGLIDNNALLKFKVDLDFSGIQVKTAEAELEKSLLLLGRESGSQVELTDLAFTEFETIPQPASYENFEQGMLNNRGEIKILETMTQVYAAQADMAKAAYYPQLKFVTSYKNYDDDFVNGSGDASVDEVRAQLVLSMNLFSGFGTRGTVAKLELEERSVKLDLEELKNELKTGLASLYLDYEVNRDNVKAALSNIDQAKENLRITRLKYNEGLQTESELLEAVSTLSRADYNHVAVITALYSNYYKLLRMAEQFSDPISQ